MDWAFVQALTFMILCNMALLNSVLSSLFTPGHFGMVYVRHHCTLKARMTMKGH